MILKQKTKQLKNFFSILAVLALAVFGFAFSSDSASATTISSAFTSQIKDTGQKTVSSGGWGNITWNTTQPSSATQIVLKARSCNDAACAGETAFSSCNALVTINTTNNNAAGSVALSGNNCITNSDQYIQYEATLSTTDATVAPSLNEVSIGYTYYPTGQTLTSSAYDTRDGGVVINQILWAESGTSGSVIDIKFQVRTADGTDAGPSTWGKWCGSTSCAATAADDDFADSWQSTSPSDDTPNTYADQRTGSDDRWVQYKVWLVTDGSAAPTLTSVTLKYVTNTSPKFCDTGLAGGPPGVCPDGHAVTTFTAFQGNSGSDIGKITINNGGVSSYPVADNEEGIGSGKDLDGLVSIQYFYDAGVTLNNGGPVGTTDTEFTVADPNNVLPTTASGGGTIMIDNNLASSTEKVEVISYTTKTGTTSAVLSGLTRSYWPAEAGDTVVYNTQKTTHTNSSKVWILASSATTKGEVGGISSTPTTISTSGLTFDPVSDLASRVYLSEVAYPKLRIAVNDGNSANQVATLDSGVFSIDTKVPVANISGTDPVIPTRVDLKNSRLDITISGTAGSTATYMRFSNSDITGTSCSDESGVSWIAYPGGAITKTLSEVSLSAGSTSAYTVYYQFKDDYCNMLTGSASSPAAPTGIDRADISYKGISPAKYRDLIWWTA